MHCSYQSLRTALTFLATSNHHLPPKLASVPSQIQRGLCVSLQVRELGDTAAKFGVDTAPALLVVCNGDPATADRYDGDFKSGPIRDFISKYAGGRKCASAVKVS